MTHLVAEQHCDGTSSFSEFPHAAASRLGAERQEHEARLSRYLTPVGEHLGLTEAVQSHDWLPQEGHLSNQNRRSFRSFRYLLLQLLIRLHTPAK